MSEPADSLREQFGDIDVYLFDQLLRGRIVSGMKVLDAGCGSGRSLRFLMRAATSMIERATVYPSHLALDRPELRYQ